MPEFLQTTTQMFPDLWQLSCFKVQCKENSAAFAEKRAQAAPAIPLDRNFPIPTPFLYLDKQGWTLFLLHDSDPGDDKILIFSTAGNLHLPSTSQE